MLFWVCECACWPLTCVMVVGEGCSGWCCFQYCVAVVLASRRVPGVLVGVSWLVCVSWFRMLMRVAPLSCCFLSFFSLLFG